MEKANPRSAGWPHLDVKRAKPQIPLALVGAAGDREAVADRSRGQSHIAGYIL